jgi:hypothetical protein
MLWRIPVDTHAQRIDRWPPPDNPRTNPNIANSPAAPEGADDMVAALDAAGESMRHAGD